jgi:hypothetical protein
LLIFSKLFTRRRLQREQEPKQDPEIERSEGCVLPVESVRHKRKLLNLSIQKPMYNDVSCTKSEIHFTPH